jgi:hypothetical protein
VEWYVQPRSTGACVLLLSCVEGLECRHAIYLRDGGLALSGEHAATMQLPVLVLLQQHRPHQAGDGGVIEEDAQIASAMLLFRRKLRLDLLIVLLQQVGAPDLFPVVLGEVAESQHVLPGILHQCGCLGEALRQRGGQVIPTRLDLFRALLGEHAAQGRGDHSLVHFGNSLHQVAGKMDATATARRSPAVAVGSPWSAEVVWHSWTALS